MHQQRLESSAAPSIHQQSGAHLGHFRIIHTALKRINDALQCWRWQHRTQGLQLPVVYRVLRWIVGWYPLGVLWLCIIAMFIAFSLMFIFPPGTLLLLFVGLAGTGLAVLGFRFLQSILRSIARHKIAEGFCPKCGAMQERANGADVWRCASCHVEITPAGLEVQHDQHQAAAEH
jgi:ribosomal protein L37AE/L43A